VNVLPTRASAWLLAVLLLSPVNRVMAADYYVSTAGQDSAAGTLAEPWRGLQRAVNAASAGDTIHVRGGTYAERVTFSNRSGTSTAPITLKSYGAERAVLDLSGVEPSNGSSAIIRIANSSYVTIQGLEVCNYQTANTARVPIGIHVTGACAGVRLLGNEIHHIRHLHAELFSFDGNAHGILVSGNNATAISNIEIDGNEVHSLWLGASEALVLNGNVTNFRVTRNEVHDCNNIGIDFIGFEGTNSNPALDYARNGLCAENVVYNIDTQYNPAYGGNHTTGGGNNTRAAAGIYVDGGASILIERNHVYNSNFGVEVASEHPARNAVDITVRNNLLRRNHVGGIFVGGYQSSRGGAVNCRFTHNTLYQNDTAGYGGGQVALQHNISGLQIKHNIMVCNSSTRQFVQRPNNTGSYAANSIDWNLYSGATTSNAAFVWQSDYIVGFTEWKSASGQDGHSRVVSSIGFNNVTALDFSLQATSPAVDSGNSTFVAAVGEADYFKRARVANGRVDIGMAEYGAPPFSGPDVITQAAEVSFMSVELKGSVVPVNQTEVWFEYGTTAALGQRTAAQILPAGTSAADFQATLTGLPSRKKYYYRAVASDSSGTTAGVQRTFTTLTAPAPVITEQPADQLVAVGEGFTLSVTATSVETVTYRWRKDGKNIADATEATYAVSAAQLADGGAYSVKVTNASGASVTSLPAAVAVFEPSPRAVDVHEDKELVLDAAIKAPADAVRYRWHKDNLPLANGGRITGADAPRLRVRFAEGADAGSYHCVFSLAAESVRTGGTIAVTVKFKPVVLPFVPAEPWIVSGVVSDQLMALHGPTSFSVTGLPSRVVLESATGRLTGSPTIAGRYGLRITARNEVGVSAPLVIELPVQALPGPSVGVFDGLLERSNAFALERLGGRLQMTISGTGSVTGSVRSAGVTNRFVSRVVGRVGSDTTFHIVLPGRPPLGGRVLTGSVENGSGLLRAMLGSQNSSETSTVVAEAVRSDWKSYGLRASTLAGRYALELTPAPETMNDPLVPQGTSQAAMRVATNGSVTVSGVLADGVAFTAHTVTSFGGRIPFYYDYGMGLGSALGWIGMELPEGLSPPFANQPTGIISWLRRPRPDGRTPGSMAAGVPEHDLKVVGSFNSLP
jgi:hypothetical protein